MLKLFNNVKKFLTVIFFNLSDLNDPLVKMPKKCLINHSSDLNPFFRWRASLGGVDSTQDLVLNVVLHVSCDKFNLISAKSDIILNGQVGKPFTI